MTSSMVNSKISRKIDARLGSDDSLSFNDLLRNNANEIDKSLTNLFDSLENRVEETLLEAMRYSALGGGKKLRSLLLRLCVGIFDDSSGELSSSNASIQAAIAIELIHAYSLVHDDLPSLDNDELRRGKPSTHVHFGESTAILVGDALQALAFEALSLSGDTFLVNALAINAGARFMVGGQSREMIARDKGIILNDSQRSKMVREKTGALFAYCGEAAAIILKLDSATSTALKNICMDFGVVYQMLDDINDNEESANTREHLTSTISKIDKALLALPKQGGKIKDLIDFLANY